MKKKSVVKIAAWSSVGLLVAGYFGFSAYQRANYLPTVRASYISQQDIDAYLSTSATIASPESETYYAPPNSKVLAVHFKVGDTVKAGDMIAEFDLTDLNNQIRLAQLTLSDRQIDTNDRQLDVNNRQLGITDAQTSLEQAQKDAERQPEIDRINTEIKEYQDEIAAYEARIQKLERNYTAPDEGYVLDEEDQQDLKRWQSRQITHQREIARLSAELSAMPKTEDMQRAVSKAENAINSAQNELTAAQNSLKSARNASETASINLNSLQRYQQDKGLVAQKDGIITELNLVEGALATNTTQALVVNSTNNLIAAFNISKYDVGTIRTGQAVTLTLGDLSYTGKVSKIGGAAIMKDSTSGGTATAQVPAIVTIDNPDENLVIGIDFDMEIHTFSKKSTLAIPVEAVMTDRGGDFCYLLSSSPERPEASKWEKRYITIGKSSDLYIEVLNGVQLDDMVVMNPPTTLEQTPLVLVDPTSLVGDSEAVDPAAITDGTAEAPAPAVAGEATDDTAEAPATTDDNLTDAATESPATGGTAPSTEAALAS